MSPTSRPSSGTVLALDFGLRRIGIATATPLTGTATPLTTLNAIAGEPDWAALDELIASWQPAQLILGLPTNTDGSESAMTEHVRKFAALLRDRYPLEISMVDERYTSAEAESILKHQRQSGLRSKRIKKTDVDSMAAAIIAASWMRQQENL